MYTWINVLDLNLQFHPSRSPFSTKPPPPLLKVLFLGFQVHQVTLIDPRDQKVSKTVLRIKVLFLGYVVSPLFLQLQVLFMFTWVDAYLDVLTCTQVDASSARM